MRFRVLWAITALVLTFSPHWGWGAEIDDLRSQVKKLEEENGALEKRLDRENETTERLSKKMNALESESQARLKVSHDPGGTPEEHSMEKVNGGGGFSGVPKLNIKGFADFIFTAEETKEEHESRFSIGEVNLFMTSEISERVSFLAEAVFYPAEYTNDLPFELQRAVLIYSLSDRFNLQIGRMHTLLGFWNQAYHHGAWLQTTVFRPEIYRFEYDYGPLPVHSIGIEMFGSKDWNPMNVEYHLGVSDGRGKTVHQVQNVEDGNKSKAVSALLSVRPHFLEGLRAGASVYVDTIPPDPKNSARTQSIDERILGTHLVYLHDRVELLGEYFHIHHDDNTSNRVFDTVGLYLQGGYKIGDWTPYYRFDKINYAEGDPYYPPFQQFPEWDVDVTKHTAGVRWDLLTWNALKFEAGIADYKGSDRAYSFTVDSSISF